jgi:ribonuclease HI
MQSQLELTIDGPSSPVSHQHHVVPADSIVVNVDGGSRGNPGPAAIGVVIRCGSDVICELGERIEDTSNNVAEYRALLRGIHLAAGEGSSVVRFRSDSELVVRQVQGRYKVKNPMLRDLHGAVLRALRVFPIWSIHHVPRAENIDADRLVNQALDQAHA